MPVAAIHKEEMWKATQIAGFQMEEFITPLEVIRILNRQKISFVLVGAYGLMGWFHKARASEDVDIVVAAKHVKKAVKALLAAFPQLVGEDQEVVVRLRNPASNKVAIDVMKPIQPHLRVLFKHTLPSELKGQKYRVPTLEMALALKFAPMMVSPNRQDTDKLKDTYDFALMVKNNADLDLKKLQELGDLVYPGGGKGILELVRRVRAGEKLIL